MSVAVIHRYEKNNDAAAAAFDVIHAETKQLQKMSLSDPQVQNKEKDLGGSDFERLFSSEAAKESMKRQREWNALHSCTKCGFCKHGCRCNVRAPRWGRWNGRSEILEMSAKKKKICAIDALPPGWLNETKKCWKTQKILTLAFFGHLSKRNS